MPRKHLGDDARKRNRLAAIYAEGAGATAALQRAAALENVSWSSWAFMTLKRAAQRVYKKHGVEWPL